MKTIRLRLLFIKKLSSKYNVLPHIKDGQNHIEQEEIITKIMVEHIIGSETSEFIEFAREYNSKRLTQKIGDKMSKSVQRDQ